MALTENKETLTNRKNTTKDVKDIKEKSHCDYLERQIIYEPVVTVDQLSTHRKRKPALTLPIDNLCLSHGSLKHLTTEYQRSFRRFEPNLLPITCKRPKRNTSLKLEGQHEFQSEYVRSYVRGTESLYRPQLIRRCTNLKLEGDFYHVTEYRENFTAFLLEKKVKLQRKATTLQLLGQMDLETENRRNFVLYQNVFRPPLCKKLTNLHLSGSLHMDTENRDKFLRYNVKKQHPLRKMPTNLHLEGTLFLQPEYTSAFVEYKNYQKQKPSLPVNNIKSPIDFIVDSDSSDSIQHPLIPQLRSYLYAPSDTPRRPSFRSSSRPNSRPPSRASDRFIDVDVEKPPRTDKRVYGSPTVIIKSNEPKIYVSKSEGNFSRWGTTNRTGSTTSKASPSRFHNKEEEARSITKSLPALHRGTWSSRACADSPELHRSKPTSPEFQGRFECQPEYRKAYINYITRERIYDQNDRMASGWKNISNEEEAVNKGSPTNKQQLRSRKSSPNLTTDPQKSLELIETAAFGRRCRNSSVSEISSSDDVIAPTVNKAQIPKWNKIHTRTWKRPAQQQVQPEDSESEPSFLVM